MSDSTALATWDPNSGAALPAYLAEALDAFGGSNLPDRQMVPSLSYEGGKWAVVINGNKEKQEFRNSDGDMEPVTIMKAVILNSNKDRGRAYYPGVYNPQAVAAPKCWSADGVAPDASVREKESPLCQGCPQSIKGSRIQDSREMVACSQHRMLAIVPAYDIEHEPLRLKIAVTSDYDKEIVEHGWFAFKQYCDYLKSKAIAHSGLVITKMKFDPNTAYPKILFAMDRPLAPAEVAKAVAAFHDPRTTKLLSETWTAAGTAGTPINDSDIAPDDGTAALARAVADGWIAHPTPGYHYKGQEVVENVELALRYPPPAAPAPKVEEPAPPPAAQQVVDATATIKIEHDPIATAIADGWAIHPDNPAYYFKDQEVLTVDALAERYPPPPAAAAAPAAPPAPPPTPPAPAAVEVPPHDPIAAAEADGWIKHPDTAGYHYRGQEVVATLELATKYPPVPTPAPAAATQAATPSATTSPSSVTDVPADVQAILDDFVKSQAQG